MLISIKLGCSAFTNRTIYNRTVYYLSSCILNISVVKSLTGNLFSRAMFQPHLWSSTG